MAKINTHTNEQSGLTVENTYWNVKFITVNIRRFQTPSLTFHFDGFASKEAANVGKTPIAHKEVTVSDPAELQTYLTQHLGKQKNLYELAYMVANAQDAFPGAIDDIDVAVGGNAFPEPE